MKSATALVALAAIALAGCGANTASGGQSPAPSAHAAAASPPSCHELYETWKAAATPQAKKMETALKKVSAAGSAEDIPKLTRALHQAGNTANALSTGNPLPKCADPHGYYALMLTRITAAGDNAQSGSGLSGLILAEAPLQTVAGIEKKLDAELNKTVGTKR